MADFAINTDTYPKAVQPLSAFQTANQYGEVAQRAQALQSGALTIQTQKLENAHTALTNFLQGVNSLGPNASKADIIAKGKNLVDTGLVPQSMVDAMDERVPDDPKAMPAFHQELMSQGLSHLEQIKSFLGLPDQVADDGSNVKVIRTPTMPGYPPSVAASYNKQLPPTQPTVNQAPGPNYQQPGIVGPSGPPGLIAGAPSNPLPVQAPQAAPAAPAATITPPANPAFATPAAAPKVVAQVPQGNGTPNFVPTGAPPQFKAGQDQYNADIDASTARASALKPALLALNKMKGIQTGPGTDQWNSAVAFLKANNIIPTGANDPTAIYQEVEKYLNQYLGQTPFRSDAEQALRSGGSPNPHKQIIQALTALTQTSIANDRLAIARPLAFSQQQQDAQGNTTVNPRRDYDKYQEFRANFPNSMDSKALQLDLMEPDARDKLLADMKKKQNTPEGQTFFKTLQAAKNLNLYNQ